MASQSNQMTLFFYTDSSVTNSGWNASVSIGDPGNCGQNFTEASGKLFHPGSPGVYLDFQDCGYLITVTPGSTIQLSWDVFDVSFILYIQGVLTSLGYAKCNVQKLRKVGEQSELRLTQ